MLTRLLLGELFFGEVVSVDEIVVDAAFVDEVIVVIIANINCCIKLSSTAILSPQ